jgi:hypothetical protein
VCDSVGCCGCFAAADCAGGTGCYDEEMTIHLHRGEITKGVLMDYRHGIEALEAFNDLQIRNVQKYIDIVRCA